MGRLFGTDGVRGVANKELTPELAFKLGRAAAHYFGKQVKQPVFIIGRDTRISGQMLESSLAAGICSAGGKAVLAGVIPTPAVAYLTRKLNAQAGVVISASHNPFADNGIKFFAGTGYKLPDATEAELESFILDEYECIPRPCGDKVGVIEYNHQLIDIYMDFLLRVSQTDFHSLKLVLDCANGAASEVAPLVYRRLGAEVILINSQPNGININNGCGSTHLESLQNAVLLHKADIGIAHDGDADRCLAVDEKGQVIDGDQIMVICALQLMRENLLVDNTLVTTIMSNIGLHQAIKEFGGKIRVTPVGDRYVLEDMLQNGYLLGGEQSGHIIFGQHTTTGDGLITAIELMAAIRKTGKRLSELGGLMTKYPQVLINVRVKSKDGWEENKNILEAIKNGETQIGESGRILVRPSGTEPLIRVMGEGPDTNQLEAIVNEIASVISQELT